MIRLVVDASVWVAAAEPRDVFFAQSREFFSALVLHEVDVAVPGLARVEVACALARRLRDPECANALTAAMFSAPFVAVAPLDDGLLDAAAVIGTDRFLRGADAIYCALAVQREAVLVAWDDEMLRRAGAITPVDWLERTTQTR